MTYLQKLRSRLKEIDNIEKFIFIFEILFVFQRRHENHYNDARHNDILGANTQHNDTQHNDIQHNGTKYNDIQYNYTRHNDT